jgi:hypothetical protein
LAELRAVRRNAVRQGKVLGYLAHDLQRFGSLGELVGCAVERFAACEQELAFLIEDPQLLVRGQPVELLEGELGVALALGCRVVGARLRVERFGHARMMTRGSVVASRRPVILRSRLWATRSTRSRSARSRVRRLP